MAESVGKKAAFLRTAIDALGLAARATVVAGRVEGLAPARWDVVTARAVGSLADLIELSLPLLGSGGHLLAWKRGKLAAEMAGGGRAAAALGGSVPRWWPYPEPFARAAGLDGHGLVVVRKVAPTPPGIPRDPAARSRRPW